MLPLPSYILFFFFFLLTATESSAYCMSSLFLMDWDVISYILFATAIVKEEEAFGCPQLCLQYCGYLLFQVQGGDDNCWHMLACCW